MNLLVPIYRDALFINEVIKSYKKHCQVSTSFNDFWLNKGDYDIIHLHWPEYLFKWEVPTDIELLLLERIFTEWHHKGTKIVVTRHNYLPHRPNPERFIPLYNLVYAHAHAVIHMGQHSEQEYLERYKELIPQKQLQVQIPHPIFTNYPNNVTPEEARKALGIGQNTLVMLVFGTVRTAAEKNLILKAFDAIQQKNKLLFAPGWKFIKAKEPVNRFKWYRVQLSKKYRISQEFIPEDQVQYYFKAADFVFLPRTDTLNSGVPFLAAVFDTPIIGFNSGNIDETLQKDNMLVLNNFNKKTFKTFVKKISNGDDSKKKYIHLLKSNSLENVGRKHIDLFNKLTLY